MHSSHCLRETDERFQLTDSNLVSTLQIATLVSGTHHLVLVFQNFSTFLAESRIDVTSKFDVGLNLLHLEIWINSFVTKSMHVDDMVSDVVIFLVILLIKNNEENVESGHKWRSNVDVISERSGSIVATENGVSCS